MRNTGQFVVIVTTDVETAVGSYVEYHGTNIWGPYDGKKAHEVCEAILQEWATVAQTDPQAFVYGVPSATVGPLLGANVHSGVADDLDLIVHEAARNWYLRLDDRERFV